MRTIRLAWPLGAPAPVVGEEVPLPLDQARHGVLVLRLKVGQEIELVGPDGLAPARVSRVESVGPLLVVRLLAPWRGRAAGAGPALGLALIQPQRFEWALEKAVELGAGTLIPLIAERCKAQILSGSRLERWRRLAVEARKQCGRADDLIVGDPVTLPILFNNIELLSSRPLVFLSPGAASAPVFPGQGGNALILVGPEGGFSPTEERLLRGNFFVPWNLGAVVLRAETAALAALAWLKLASAAGTGEKT